MKLVVCLCVRVYVRSSVCICSVCVVLIIVYMSFHVAFFFLASFRYPWTMACQPISVPVAFSTPRPIRNFAKK